MNITLVSLWAQKLFRSDEPQPFGGAELQLVLLARALANFPDVTVRFITRGQGSTESFRSGLIHVHKLPYRHKRSVRSLLGFWDCLRACMVLPTDLFIQRGGGFETGIAAHAARSAQKPFVFMTSSTWDVDGTHEQKRGWLYGKTYMYGLRHASSIITQTQHQHDLLLDRYHRESTVLRSAHPLPETLPAERNGVLWVGRCEPCKNPELFLDLALRIPDIPCTMVCPPANQIDRFEQIQSRAQSIPNVRFLPGVSFEETESLFASHQIMVNTSTQEGYPNTYVQAFKWGVPVVTALFDPDNILTQHKMGLRTGENSEDMARGIRDLVANTVEWNELSQNAHTFALQNHDVNRIAAQLYQNLQETIRQHALKHTSA